MPRVRLVILCALLYVVVGYYPGEFARTASAIPVRNAWRLSAWLLSFVVFAGQVYYEKRRLGRALSATALDAAAAVALGAILVALVGPVRSHWGTDTQGRALAAVVIWPVMLGIPAFLAALAGGALLDRVAGPAKPTAR